jgi:hypothetical protein
MSFFRRLWASYRLACRDNATESREIETEVEDRVFEENVAEGIA